MSKFRCWMIFLVLILFLSTFGLAQQNETSQNSSKPSGKNTIWENVKAMPELSLLSKGLRYGLMNSSRELLSSCEENRTFTLMAPSDVAVRKEMDRINALLKDSGYPSLEEIGKNISANIHPLDLSISFDEDISDDESPLNYFQVIGAASQLEEIAFAACNPWWLSSNPAPRSSFAAENGNQSSSNSSNNRASIVLPPGFNVTQWLLDYSQQSLRYIILNGTFLADGLPAHNFPRTEMNETGPFLQLGGDAQRMHLENTTASCKKEAGNSTASKSNFREFFRNLFALDVFDSNMTSRPTGIVALFGGAGDPLSEETCERIRKNETTDYGYDAFISQVEIPDIISANGVIHVVDRVIELPFNLSYVLYVSNQTSFLQALNRSGLIDHIQNTPNITIFAPTDASMKGMQDKNDSELRGWCLEQIAKGAYYTTELKSGMELEPAFGSQEKGESNSNVVQMDDESNSGSNSTLRVEGEEGNFKVNQSKLVKTNLLLRNGVLHFVDRWFNNSAASAMTLGAGRAGGNASQNGGQALCNGTSSGFMPAFPSSTLNASKLGCDASNRVCDVVDFKWLQCATQRDMMDQEERGNCPSNATFVWPSQSGDRVEVKIPVTPTCYNVSTHVCTNGYALCPIEAPDLCGVQCYNTNSYNCYQSFSLCPTSAPLRCGQACYSDDKYSCSKGELTSKGGSSNSTGGNSTDSGNSTNSR